MRLKEYLLEYTGGDYDEPRSKSLSEEQAEKILRTKCKQALYDYKLGNVIYRGLVKNSRDNYRLTDPKKGEKRQSAYATGNYYTLIMENAPEWKNFPKRDIICTTGIGEAIHRGKGNAHIVFPFDGFKIGICPTNDIWEAFEINGCDFNQEVGELLEYKGYDYNKLSSNWKLLKKAMKEIKLYESSYDPGCLNDYDEMRGRFDILRIFGGSTLYDAAVSNISPEDFKVVKKIPKISAPKEVWTDSPSVLVRHNFIEKSHQNVIEKAIKNANI